MLAHVHFTVYRLDTGQIVVNGFGPDDTVASYAGPGCGYVLGSYSPNSFYIPGGQPTPLPDRPDLPHVVFDFATGQWVDHRSPEEVERDNWAPARRHRDNLLAQSDWTQLPDVPLPTKQQWAAYRQALRDITDQPDPFNIVWPTPPA